mgnify:CR=1 FL=1
MINMKMPIKATHIASNATMGFQNIQIPVINRPIIARIAPIHDMMHSTRFFMKGYIIM